RTTRRCGQPVASELERLPGPLRVAPRQRVEDGDELLLRRRRARIAGGGRRPARAAPAAAEPAAVEPVARDRRLDRLLEAVGCEDGLLVVGHRKRSRLLEQALAVPLHVPEPGARLPWPALA